MKKHLTRVYENLKASLFTIESIIRASEDPIKRESLKPALASFYLLKRETEDIISTLESIREDCIAELNDNFKSRCPSEDEEYFYDPEKDNPWSWLQETLNSDELSFTIDLRRYIAEMCREELEKSKSMLAIIPGVQILNEGKKVTTDEMLQGNLTADYQATANLIEGYPYFIDKLQKLADTRGSLAEIIALVE